MTAIDSILGQPAAQAIGWALLQFVWQGALIGGLTFLALLALRRSAADVRYVVASIGLAVMLTMPVVTARQAWRSMTLQQQLSGLRDAAASVQLLTVESRRREWLSWPDPAAAGSIRPAGNGTLAVPHSNFGRIAGAVPPAKPAASESPRLSPAAWTRVAVIVWFTGVLALSLRLLTGWFIVRRLATHGATDAPPEWRQLVARLARQLHISRPIRLLQSALVEVPTVIGWVRPVVLVPVSALAGMAPSQLEAILAHELAHIRRHDYLVNLLQTVVETLLFYHPAVWWLSRRIRIERENCCDDLAVSLCGDPYAYAQALADLEERRGSVFALAASGGSLIDRVRRLLTAPAHPAPGRRLARGQRRGSRISAVSPPRRSASTSSTQGCGALSCQAGRRPMSARANRRQPRHNRRRRGPLRRPLLPKGSCRSEPRHLPRRPHLRHPRRPRRRHPASIPGAAGRR